MANYISFQGTWGAVSWVHRPLEWGVPSAP